MFSPFDELSAWLAAAWLHLPNPNDDDEATEYVFGDFIFQRGWKSFEFRRNGQSAGVRAGVSFANTTLISLLERIAITLPDNPVGPSDLFCLWVDDGRRRIELRRDVIIDRPSSENPAYPRLVSVWRRQPQGTEPTGRLGRLELWVAPEVMHEYRFNAQGTLIGRQR